MIFFLPFLCLKSFIISQITHIHNTSPCWANRNWLPTPSCACLQGVFTPYPGVHTKMSSITGEERPRRCMPCLQKHDEQLSKLDSPVFLPPDIYWYYILIVHISKELCLTCLKICAYLYLGNISRYFPVTLVYWEQSQLMSGYLLVLEMNY